MPPIELNNTSLVTSANLKAYYRFESGALTTDSSGEGHTLTAISNPAEDFGQFGNGAVLDADDAFSAVDHADFKPTGNFSIGGWIQTTAVSAVVMQSWSQNTNFAGIMLRISSIGALYLYSGRNTGTVAGTHYQVAGGGTVNNNAWHYVVGTWDGSNLRLYIDGALSGSAVAWANAPAYAATNYVRLGCGNQSGTNVEFCPGIIDDVFFFNGTALSADTIASIYDGTINSPSTSISTSPSISISSSVSTSLSTSISTSISSSRSTSISSSISTSRSTSISSSVSSSPSPSTSISSSPSISISSSLSTSVSSSLSNSVSTSLSSSLSQSVSSSVSASPSISGSLSASISSSISASPSPTAQARYRDIYKPNQPNYSSIGKPDAIYRDIKRPI